MCIKMQALLDIAMLTIRQTQAILMQIIGNSTGCWGLTTHASRTLMMLGHHVHREPGDGCHDMHEIYAAVAWCYHFDRLLSLLLLRPLTLPPYAIPVASLIQHDAMNPMSIFAAFWLETVPVMEKIVELTVDNAPVKGSAINGAEAQAAVEQLRIQMEDIFSKMQFVCFC